MSKITPNIADIRTVRKELKIKYKALEKQAKETIKQMKAVQKEIDKVSNAKQIVKKKVGRKSSRQAE